MADALQLFRKERKFLAVVRDGSGPVVGLITMEDILEEIVGDIEDEHDRPSPWLKLRRQPPPGLAERTVLHDASLTYQRRAPGRRDRGTLTQPLLRTPHCLWGDW